MRHVHMGVNLRRVEIAMAKHIGHFFEGGPLLDQVTGQGVAAMPLAA